MTLDIARLESLAKEATPGEASLERLRDAVGERYKLMLDASAERHGMWVMTLCEGDANFAANLEHLLAAWNALPALVAEVRRLEKENERLKAERSER